MALFRYALVLSLVLGPGCRGEQSVEKSSLRLAVQYELATLDPHAQNKISNLAILSNFYEPLVRTEANMTLKPCLASLWENTDPNTWVFHLRKDVHFSNGKQMDAGDVVHSFQRLLKKGSGLELAGYISNIGSVSARDRFTVELRTQRPVSILLNKVSFVMIVPENVDPDLLDKQVVGTGPYKLSAWKMGESIHIIRNESYWGRRPDASSAVFLLGTGTGDALDLLLKKQIDFAQCNDKRLERAVRGRKDLKAVRWDSIFVKILAFNFRPDAIPYCSVSPNPFLHQKVREAIHLAVDRQSLVSRLQAPAVPGSQPVPPFTFGYNPSISYSTANVPRARRLLADAGFPHGFSVTLHTRKLLLNAAKEIQTQLGFAGIKVELRVLDDVAFFSELRSGQFAFYISRFGCATGDASDILDYTLHTVDPELHFGGQNYGRYSNPELDRAIEQSGEILSPERRRERLQKIMTLLVQDLPWVPLYVDQDAYAYSSRLSWHPRNDSLIQVADIRIAE